MAEDRRQLIKSLGFLSSVGITLVASCLIGLAMGYFLDKWLAESFHINSSPWGTLTFLGLGIFSGFRNVYILTERELRRQEREKENEQQDRE